MSYVDASGANDWPSRLELIGEGSMGTVFRAQHIPTGANVAVKVRLSVSVCLCLCLCGC
jgi:hypothetical protein